MRFLQCPARQVDSATLTTSGSDQGQDQLSVSQHKCSHPDCKIPSDGGFTRGLKDIKARMRKDGDDFWVGFNKDRSVKLKLVLEG